MNCSISSDVLKRIVYSRKVEWQRHALERMAERLIGRSNVLHVLVTGECVEDYPATKPFPSALFLGWFNTKPLHVVMAYDVSEERAFIITAYEPNLEHFESDFKTRRTPWKT